MRTVAIIVAGGSGTRFGAEVPKQFLELGGRPILMRTIEVFGENGDGSFDVIFALWQQPQLLQNSTQFFKSALRP